MGTHDAGALGRLRACSPPRRRASRRSCPGPASRERERAIVLNSCPGVGAYRPASYWHIAECDAGGVDGEAFNFSIGVGVKYRSLLAR